ncbi:MAG: hypothetical protein HOV82_04630, partial [Streptomyces sp.]|nr:hypothetical protein [Streptomyces sp.]
RTPAGGATRTAPDDGRPPGSPNGTGPTARTRPADNRPATPTTTPTAPSTLRASHAVPTRTPHNPVPQLHPTDHIAELLVLVLSGQRPVHSMLRHTVGQAYDELATLAERGPLRARGTRPVVRDIGYYVPRPGAFEAFARIGAGDQLRAMAFRVEQGRDRRWRCTAVELGGLRDHRTDDN